MYTSYLMFVNSLDLRYVVCVWAYLWFDIMYTLYIYRSCQYSLYLILCTLVGFLLYIDICCQIIGKEWNKRTNIKKNIDFLQNIDFLHWLWTRTDIKKKKLLFTLVSIQFLKVPTFYISRFYNANITNVESLFQPM